MRKPLLDECYDQEPEINPKELKREDHKKDLSEVVRDTTIKTGFTRSVI